MTKPQWMIKSQRLETLMRLLRIRLRKATDEKEAKRAEVIPVTSIAFSFSSEDSEFKEETGYYASMKLRCLLCVPTRRDTYVAPYEADSMYSLGHHMQKIHALVVCPGLY